MQPLASPFKNLFSKLGRREAAPPAPARPPAAAASTGFGETSSILTGDDRIDSRNIKLLLETMADLISDHDPAGLVRKIVDRALKAVRAERCILLLRDGGDALQVAVALDDQGRDLGDQFRYSKTLVQKALDQPECLIRSIGDSDAATDLSASIVDLKLRAVMCVRLSFKDEVTGVIYVDSRATERTFNAKDSRFFEALARAISIVLENARLLRAALERERLQRAIELAREVLAKLLPKDPLGVPGFDIAGLSLPAESAAGDYYDFVPCPDGRVGLVIGDVTGHGIGPAMVMTGARSALRMLFEEEALDEAEILRRLNMRLVEDLGDGRFMSLLVGRLDVRKRVVTWANAGQNPPIVLRADGRVETLAGAGLALGIETGVAYQCRPPLTLGSGDVLLWLTDGLVEARNPAGEELGEARVIELLRQNRELSSRQLLAKLREVVVAHSGREQQEDDVTLLAVRAL
jgi:serine phosphatase RsbU (regulator of sigma subunit)